MLSIGTKAALLTRPYGVLGDPSSRGPRHNTQGFNPPDIFGQRTNEYLHDVSTLPVSQPVSDGPRWR